MLLETCLYHSVGTVTYLRYIGDFSDDPSDLYGVWWQLLELLLEGSKSEFTILEGALCVRLGSHLRISCPSISRVPPLWSSG
jgi:hypothetical protein